MSTTIRIVASRGTTSYECVIEEGTQEGAQAKATQFEKWINEQPDRLALNDTQSRSNS